MKNRKHVLAMTFAFVIALMSLGQPVHALTTTGMFDRASYVPGDSGTLTVTIINTDTSSSLEVRNLTIYYPWAQLVDGKWPSGANVSVNFSPFKELGSQGNGNNVYTSSYSISIPSWYSGNVLGFQTNNCPGNTNNRYGLYNGCILVGTTSTNPRYEGQDLGIQMAVPTYTPTSLVAQWLPIATLVVLVVATAFLGMTWLSLRRAAKKA